MSGIIHYLEGIPPLLRIGILSMLPAIELSGSIPYGLLATRVPVWLVVSTALLANWLVAPMVFFFMRHGVEFMQRFRWFARLWAWYSERVLQRVHKFMSRWGSWGLLLFIAVPGPGSGLYTCSVAAYLLGVETRRFVVVALVGQLIAAGLVTAVILSGSTAYGWMVNKSLVGAE